MTYPQTPLDVLVELFVSGAWTDITDDVLMRDGIHIERGRHDEGARVDPGKCTLTVNNGASKVAPGVEGRYSARNPRSDLYGLIGRNTPVRVSALAGSSYLNTTGTTDRARTPDAAAISITGDIDIRVDAYFADWAPATPTEVAGKYLAAGGRSWLIFLYQGQLWFYWSNDGTTEIHSLSTAQLAPPASGRMALRVTMDVDNGAGGRTIRFYTGTSVTGPWTLLGDPVVQAGTTSIYDNAEPLDVGAVGPITFADPVARYYALQLRNGIDGTVVANPDFTAQTPGATSFTDSAGLVWTLDGNATLTNRRTRFTGEIPSWPARWDVSGNDRYVPVQASGVLRRLGQGAKALQSTLRRKIPTVPYLMAYWPMEEGTDATQASSPVPGVAPLTLSPANWAAVDSLPSSEPLPTINSAGSEQCQLSAKIPRPSGTPLESWEVQYLYRLDNINSTVRTFMRIRSTGTVTDWYIQMGAGLSRILGKDADGATVITVENSVGTDLWGQWIAVEFQMRQTGPTTVQVQVTWTDIGGDAGGSGDTFTGTIGYPTGLGAPDGGYSADLDGLALGHISAWRAWNGTTGTAYDRSADAWAGESAGARMQRLAAEEALPLTVVGDVTAQALVGSQRPDTLLNLVEDAADADGGILYERREALGLIYRDRASLYNQAPTLELDYASEGHVAPPLEPVDDDQLLRNDRTVQRTGGASYRAVLEEGTLSVQDPPDGVGVYDDSTTLNLYSDEQTGPQANWRLHLGTWDAERYPAVSVNLAAAPELIDDVCAMDSGARLTIANSPPWLPPGLIDLHAQGYTEMLGHPTDWDLTFNCTPAGPWTVAAVPVVENFEDSTYAVTATNGGTLPWARSQLHYNTGAWSLRSGAITNNQTSDWTVSVPAGSTEMRFWYWTSSEASGPGYEGDRLLVLVDDVQVLRAQGTTGWTQAIIDVTDAGRVTFRYTKDNSASSGEDAAHIDDLSFTGRGPCRVDTSGSKLAADATSSATSLSVAVTAGQPWITSAAYPTEFPFDIEVGGEVMTVTGISGTSSPQTFTVARSVNGIVKAQTADTPVALADPAYTSL